MLIPAGPSHVNVTNPTPQANLPFRQAFRQPVCAPEPKIHDITEKFLKASDGMLFPSVALCIRKQRKKDSGVIRLTVAAAIDMHNRTTKPKHKTDSSQL